MPPDTFAGDLGGDLPAPFRVWPGRVVIVSPDSQHEAGMGPRGKQRFVVAFTAPDPFHPLAVHMPARPAQLADNLFRLVLPRRSIPPS